MLDVKIDRRRGEDGWGAAAAAPTPPLSPFGAAVSSVGVSSVSVNGSGSALPALALSNVATVATPAPSPSPLALHGLGLAHVKSDRYANVAGVDSGVNASVAAAADYGIHRPFMAQPRVNSPTNSHL